MWGDLDVALTHAFSVAEERGLTGRRPNLRALTGAVRTAFGLDLIGRPPAPPATQAKIRGRLHSKQRDRNAISHHYDTSAEFYGQILDPETMAYSCGYHSSPTQPLADAQRAKLDLVCRKLGLEAGMRVLDVGCGWGSFSLYAAEHHGVKVTGLTISAEQQGYAAAEATRRGLSDRVDIRLQDYRDVEGEYDAVVSLEMGEHVGRSNYPTYAQVLHDHVRPGGRVLVQQMSRSGKWPGGGPFIESFIAPDMYMRPAGETADLLQASGLEPARRARPARALRADRGGLAGALREEHRRDHRVSPARSLVRVWRLYLVGGSMAFRDGRMGVDQFLLVRPGAPHGLPWTRTW
ncbi:cyclopropane-fatty-acyl-phospholipid synthase family protein [Nocardioides convexus]|uniref:SAM-dependent methyltransferase n=1 Tax=Nocardioides convexus TaxID=2712224 RepID=UPI00241888B4|nr:cyclopropane-fatty-acyl-phospholipid synthase family protein [Nocardioides convexus]